MFIRPSPDGKSKDRLGTMKTTYNLKVIGCSIVDQWGDTVGGIFTLNFNQGEETLGLKIVKKFNRVKKI
jgi:hypothetical protein